MNQNRMQQQQQQQQPKERKPEWDLLLSAAQKNNANQIIDMIQQDGVDPSHSNVVGQSALHIASLWGNVAAVEALVSLGANVNAQNNLTGASPLHMVVQTNKIKTFKDRIHVITILIQNGANINLSDNYGNIPYDSLLQKEDSYMFTDMQLEELNELLVVKQQAQSIPPLLDAIVKRDTAKVFSIVQESDPPESVVNIEYDGKTVFQSTIDELVQVLEQVTITTTTTKTTTKSLSSVLSSSVSTETKTINHEEFVEEMQKLYQIIIVLLMQGKANPTVLGVPLRKPKQQQHQRDMMMIPDSDTTGEDMIPLHKLVCTLRIVYQKMNGTTTTTTTTTTAQKQMEVSLSAAADVLENVICKIRDCTRSILTNNNNIDKNDNNIDDTMIVPSDTKQLLYQAARWDEIRLLQFLIEQLKMNPNTAGPQQMTPLHFASRSGRMNVLRYLLKQPGINVNAKDNRGKTPLDAAIVNNKQEAVEELELFLKNNNDNYNNNNKNNE